MTSRSERPLTEDELEEISDAFKLFDTDGDDKIDAMQLATVMRSLGYNPTPAEVRAGRLPLDARAARRRLVLVRTGTRANKRQ